MLRGTTLGWALEAGFNRVWIAGPMLWLPLILIVDSVVGESLVGRLIAPELYGPSLSVGLWPGLPAAPESWLAAITDTGPELWLPMGHLRSPSLGAMLVGVVALCGWLWERRRPRSEVRRRFTRTALVPLLGAIAVLAPVVTAVIFRVETGRVLRGATSTNLYSVMLGVDLLLATSLGGLVLWLPLARTSRSLVPVMLVSGGVMGALAGRAAIVTQFAATGDLAFGLNVATAISTVYWVAFPVALGAAFGAMGLKRCLAAWAPMLVIVLAGAGVQIALAVPAMALPEITSGEHGSDYLTKFWLLPALGVATIEAVGICVALVLARAIGALGEIDEAGEDAAPVDAAPAQEQP